MRARPLLPALLALALVSGTAAQTCRDDPDCDGYACDLDAPSTCACAITTGLRACEQCDEFNECLDTDCTVFGACSECDPGQCTTCSDPNYAYSEFIGLVSPPSCCACCVRSLLAQAACPWSQHQACPPPCLLAPQPASHLPLHVRSVFPPTPARRTPAKTSTSAAPRSAGAARATCSNLPHACAPPRTVRRGSCISGPRALPSSARRGQASATRTGLPTPLFCTVQARRATRARQACPAAAPTTAPSLGPRAPSATAPSERPGCRPAHKGHAQHARSWVYLWCLRACA